MENKTCEEKIIFPTSYFPPLFLAAAMAQHASKEETIFIEDCETFPKQTLRNRTVILTANGAMTLSVPIFRTHRAITRQQERSEYATQKDGT